MIWVKVWGGPLDSIVVDNTECTLYEGLDQGPFPLCHDGEDY